MNRSVSQAATLFLLISLLLLPACGKDDSNGIPAECKAPQGSTIAVTPASVTTTTLVPTGVDITHNFSVQVLYPDGSVMPSACVTISGEWAYPSSPNLYQFYYYPGGTNRPGGNVALNSGFTAQTDDFGVYDFSIVIPAGSGTFLTDIMIQSGAATPARVSVSIETS